MLRFIALFLGFSLFMVLGVVLLEAITTSGNMVDDSMRECYNPNMAMTKLC